ncbi:MAG: transglutaminase family protein [Acidobacteriota bacterium]|nr:transglutaminase family protein [Acidobacteriota bacterium]
MLIRLGYDIRFDIPRDVPVVALLNVHPSREADLREPDDLSIEPALAIEKYVDSFGNHCCRFVAPVGALRLHNTTLIEDSGEPDFRDFSAREIPVEDLPAAVLQFLLPSRYCEVDLLSNTAAELFGHLTPGWGRVQAVLDWVNQKVTFGYGFARPTKTALDVYTERLGVCRDFQHLAITFCRALNIPARYATGYLGDIGVPLSDSAMDFSAWFEVYLEGRWWTCDARHNIPRIGRVLMATGRDAADVALTTSFGSTRLAQFTVITDEVKSEESGTAGSSASA